MQCLEVSGAVRPIYGSLGFKRLSSWTTTTLQLTNLLLSVLTDDEMTQIIFRIC